MDKREQQEMDKENIDTIKQLYPSGKQYYSP